MIKRIDITNYLYVLVMVFMFICGTAISQDFVTADNFNNKIAKEAYFLKEAWGIKESFGGYTKEHCHLPSYLSGSIYLNDHDQKIYFPDIKKEIKPRKGTFVLFSSFLKHYTNRNNTNKSKYALAFNFDYTTIYGTDNK